MRYALLLTTLLVVAALSTPTYAAEQQATKATYMRLMDVQKAWEDDNYPKAFEELQQALNKAADKPFDIAIIQQYVAHTAILSGEDHRAQPALENALQQPGLPLKLQADLKLFLGQIVLGDEKYDEARDMLEFWFANKEGEAQPSNLFSLSYANYMTGNLPRAEQFVEMAINATSKPNDSWYQIYYQVLFEQKKYAKALRVLHGLLDRDPGQPRYWRMLANHHMQVEESKDALAAMAIAYNGDMFDEVADLKRVSSLYGYVEIPEKAARLTEQWVSEGLMEEDAETLRKLGDLWLLSRNRAKAKNYLKRAAAANKDNETIELLGSLHFEDEEWRLAHSMFAQVLDSQGRRDAEGEIIELEDPLRLHMLAGISAFRAGMNNEARTSLRRATEDPGFRGQARALLKKLNEG
jgi:uncharacterized protein HemY